MKTLAVDVKVVEALSCSSGLSYAECCCLDGVKDYAYRDNAGINKTDDAYLKLRHSM